MERVTGLLSHFERRIADAALPGITLYPINQTWSGTTGQWHREADGPSNYAFSLTFGGMNGTGEGGCLSSQRMSASIVCEVRIPSIAVAQRRGAAAFALYSGLKNYLESSPAVWDYQNTGVISLTCGPAAVTSAATTPGNLGAPLGSAGGNEIFEILYFTFSMEVDT